MTDHTPGPWLINDRTEGETIILADVITVDDSLNIALVYGGLDESEANAFLIAAAPDMLTALILIEKNWKEWEIGEIMHLVRATIEKAEGRRREKPPKRKEASREEL